MEKYSGLTKEGLVTFEGLVILFRLMVEVSLIKGLMPPSAFKILTSLLIFRTKLSVLGLF
jgi:hypothetical protein